MAVEKHGPWLRFTYSEGGEAWADMRLVTKVELTRSDGKWVLRFLAKLDSYYCGTRGSNRDDADLALAYWREFIAAAPTRSSKPFGIIRNAKAGVKL